MSAATAELTLILKAQNLTGTALADVKTKLSMLSGTARQVATDMVSAFKGMGPLIAIQLARAGADILQGKDPGGQFALIGVMIAGAIVEGLAATFIPAVLGWLAGTAVFAPVIAALTAEGATLGGVLAAAIVGGMAALPVLLTAALAAATAYAISQIGKGTAAGNLSHVTGTSGVNTRQYYVPPTPGTTGGHSGYQYAAGGWAGLHGPEHAWLGENGPEFVRKAGTGTGDEPGRGAGGFTIQGISEREIVDMVDRGLYFRLQRTASSSGRV